jgi:hypothetical protein
MRNKLVLPLTLCLLPVLCAQVTGQVQTTAVTLTSAQLQHAKSTPIQLVAAPGSGQMLNVLSAVAQYKAGSSPYAVASGRLGLFLGNPGNVIVASAPAAGFLDQTTNQVRPMPESVTEDDQSSFENQPLMVTNDGSAEWANGDGTVTITVTYTVVALQ